MNVHRGILFTGFAFLFWTHTLGFLNKNSSLEDRQRGNSEDESDVNGKVEGFSQVTLTESDFLQVNQSEFFAAYDQLTSNHSAISDTHSPEVAREKLMKVNPNLVNFIERVMKMREENSGFAAMRDSNSWKDFESHESQDELADICLFSPNGACHVHVSHKCEAVTYESLFTEQKSDAINECTLHEKYLGVEKPSFSQSESHQQWKYNVTSMSSKLRVRYKCEISHQVFPANQTGLVKSLSPEQFVKAINGSRACILAVFYSPYCAFSVQLAPHMSALARNFPAIHVVAVDALLNKNLDARLGVVGTPSLLFFYNDQTIARYSGSDLETMASLLTNLTGLNPEGVLDLKDADFEPGPLPLKVIPRIDLFALCSTLICTSFLCALLIQFTSVGAAVWIKVQEELRELPLMQFIMR